MRAWWVDDPGPVRIDRLKGGERPDPVPGQGELLLAVKACGVCRTDLHLAEGDLQPRASGVIPGHEAVAEVAGLGEGCTKYRIGDRVGAAWLGATCGACRFCLGGRENLCLHPRFTGWDLDGGYAEFMVVKEDFAYAIPDAFSDEEAAPLLCAGIIGYRALRRAAVPRGGRLGIYGFGASAHLAAQIAIFEGAEVYVMTRSENARRLALALGAVFAGDSLDRPPVSLDSAILFAPAGELVPVALRALDRGGTLAVAGIHLSDIPPLKYGEELFQERQLRSVTANTRQDGMELMEIASRIPLRPATTAYPFDEANKALMDLAADRVTGAAVLRIGNGRGH
ncbi:zinc-dependent alcohol dehydrogenase family protein [Arthrobacter silvisoli]|uniref:zinc-dependent alcohol dehydrogenase family protein n=1 Tax=Arthrobacter silvisoli TaxID=2291022 RepID=UPI000E20E849|nr:zinc-dependent alcohol dehydrogenase family protein [Arthrobacter silvisoli]